MKNNNLKHIKNSGFKIPENYFSTLEDHMMSYTKLKSSIDSAGFKMPTGYLETLEPKLIHKTKSKVLGLVSRTTIMYLSGIAAAILIFISITVFENKITFESLDANMVEHYMLDEDISTTDLATLITDDELTVLENDIINFDEADLENYLLEQTTTEDLEDYIDL